jgi:hypothetical protein
MRSGLLKVTSAAFFCLVAAGFATGKGLPAGQLIRGVPTGDEEGPAPASPGSGVLAAVMRKAPLLIFNGDNTEMDVHWQLNLTDTCTLEWGTDSTYSLGSDETVEYGSDHQHAYTIGGLDPGTRYCYRVSVEDEEYAGYFRAAPPTDRNSVKFFAYGDTRSYPADHNLVAGSLVSRYEADPDFLTFVLSVGDLVTDGNVESYWDNEFFNPSYPNIREVLGHLPYQVAMGNHEGTGVLFKKYFPYPFVAGRYWSFDYGPAHFTIVDQYTSYGPGSAQLNWIESDLASTSKPWKFICLHEPGWSAGGHSNNLSVQNYIQPLCVEYGVAMVFGGHNHYYARAEVGGVEHITTGGGGAPLYTPDPGYPNVVACAKAFHACTVEIEGGCLHFEAVTPAGALLDSLTMCTPDAGVSSGSRTMESSWELRRVDPNPFSSRTTLTFWAPERSNAAVAIYDTAGRRVKILADRAFERGLSSMVWDGTGEEGMPLSPGVYFCVVRSAGRCLCGKLVLMR